MLKRSSQGHLISVTKRFSAIRTYAQFKAYIATNQFTDALLAMTPADRTVALTACGNAYARIDAKAPIPKQGSTRVEAWDAAMQSRIRALEAKYGNDNDIARELKMPIKAVRTARWKFCGPRRPRTRRPSSVAAATPEIDARAPRSAAGGQ